VREPSIEKQQQTSSERIEPAERSSGYGPTVCLKDAPFGSEKPLPL